MTSSNALIEKAAWTLEPWLRHYPPSTREKHCYEAVRAVLRAVREDDAAVEAMARGNCAWDGPCGHSKCPEDGKTCRGNISENEMHRMRAALDAILGEGE